MSGDLSVDDGEQPLRGHPPDESDPPLVATVVEYEEVPDECTIHPIEPTEEELMTCWVTASEGSFVALPDAR